MGDFEAGHYYAYAFWVESLLLCCAYLLGDIHQVGVDLWGEVDPVIGLLAGDDQGVALGDRIDGHEGG